MLKSLIRVIPCPVYRATAETGSVRTLSAAGKRLSVTWHTISCPHHAADLILAGEPADSRNRPSL
ncbi:hypothetical protein [Streptomyces virginiae]|uniref:hypothetical protein n=1 Tax=Streptomyces virginiae TaxID=1961 RepID=UPI002257243C|nr:hypothetical protein [Streptomyces virginiae]MCX4960947.1 hypothetical protein [Streptomyces virginiae]